MAQSGYTPTLIYGSGSTGNTPSASNLTSSASGAELALNYFDGKLFYKDASGNVQVLASKAGNINVSSLSFGTTGLTPSTATTGAITVAGTLVVGNGGTGVTTSTGSGSVVLSTSPTLVTPLLGTPSSGTLTNCTFPTLNQNTTGTAANVTGIVAQDNGGTGTTTGYYAFKNRIINGAMVIDQRNAHASFTVGTGAALYVADRFYCFSGGGQTFGICDTSLPTGSGFQYALKLQPQTGATSVQVTQKIESFNSFDLAGQNVTFSFWIYTSGLSGTSSYVQPYTPTATDNYAGTTYGASQAISYTNGSWVKNTFTFSTSSSSMNSTYGLALLFNFASAVGATIYITGVQLEKGSTATSFDYRPYGTELALCQRYFWTWTGGSYVRYAIGYNDTTTSTQFCGYLPTSMRTTPSVTAMTNFTSNGTAITIATIASNSNQFSLGATGTALLVGASQIYVAAGTTAVLSLSAEL